MPRHVFIILTAAILYCGGCSRSSPPSPPPSTTLPSGKQIRITSIARMHFASGETALVFNCETDIAMDDIPDLRKESDEIWTSFQKKVEASNLTNGVIRMTHPAENGTATQSKGYGFVYQKGADGQWRCQP